MTFSSSGFIKGSVISLMVCLLVYLGLRSFGVIGVAARDPADPEALAATAREALDAVKRRKPEDRRPASYDAVLAPLDKMLRQVKDMLAGNDYNPDRDFPKIRTITGLVIDIATQADRQARTETGPLAKTFRFNDQKGEACQYLANALWERLNANRSRKRGALDSPDALPQNDLNELMRILDTGIEAAPDNRELYYIRGVVNREEGLYGPAAKDLEQAITIDPGYAAAWNTLGLVRISLKEFEGAEDALEKARGLTLEDAKRFKSEPGPEYLSVIYNLAMFHDGLAAYYSRENRVNPSVESKRLLAKHVADARRYWEEFLRRVPESDPDARDARNRLNALPA